ncbi:hypothetical protein GIS00_12140 [Nakamurella sp. YIM 132087]|uniref:Uncharacterized protein n=1 Tax=Nakamurella alba TaxID=2665158 RepID=A0A7K1FKM7_9ACTN|nr:hypothetical protein [Nakamurella alba]MTD14692.1 hypothetical protein [Nakamurella alba]
MTEEEDRREIAARGRARAAGLDLHRSSDHEITVEHGGYMLADRSRVILGATPHPFSAGIDEIEDYLAEHLPRGRDLTRQSPTAPPGY